MRHILMIGSTELILIVVVVLLLFGGKKIPELMRGLGRGVRNFKEGMNEPEEPVQDVRPNNDADTESVDRRN